MHSLKVCCQWGTWQCCCMIAKQLILVKEVGDSYKYEKSRKPQISQNLLKYISCIWKSESLLRGNKYQVSCHVLRGLFWVEYAIFMTYHPKSNHSSHCHHSSHIDHIFSLYMFLPGPATKEEAQSLKAFPHISSTCCKVVHNRTVQ